MTTVDRLDIAPLVPHAGSMCLLDDVVSWNAQSIHAAGHRYKEAASHPLSDGRVLHAIHLAEYGAQAMAIHGALLARERGDAAVRSGRLVSLRDVVLTDEYVDFSLGHLDVHAICLYADLGGSQYTFRIEQAARLCASGRAAVMHS